MKRFLLVTIFLFSSTVSVVNAELIFYKIQDKFIYPDIYIVQDVEHLRTLDQMKDRIASDSVSIKGYLVATDSATLNVKNYHKTYLPKISYKKINSHLFQIKVEDNKDYIIVFNQRYHPAWNLRSAKQEFSCQNSTQFPRFNVEKCDIDEKWPFSLLMTLPFTHEIISQDHFEINHLVNAWYVPASNSSRNFYLTFDVEGYMLISAAVCVVTVGSLLTYLIWRFIKTSSIMRRLIKK